MKIINKMQPEGRQHSCLTSKGFAISGIMYAILIISLLLVLGTLKTLQNRKTIIDKIKSETVDALDIKNYDDLLVALESLDEKVRTLDNNFLDKTYPVGSIYISTRPDNPSTLFGDETTWESFGQGRTLIGAGTGTDKNGTQKTFTVSNSTETEGEYTHTLSVAEMPSHNHSLYLLGNVSGVTNSGYGAAINSINSFTSYAANVNTHAVGYGNFGFMHNTGDGNTHNNIQPYVVTYMWKRIS